MKIEEIIKKTIDKTDLQKDESKYLFSNIMEGKIKDEDLKKSSSTSQKKEKLLRK